MNDALQFLANHPLYIPFLILNIFIIYRVFSLIFMDNDDDQDQDDDSDDPNPPKEPDLDLPPGVSLPIEPEMVEEHQSI